jgi:hypothetical protein
LVQSLADLDLRLDNQRYEKHDRENAFIANFTKQASRALK